MPSGFCLVFRLGVSTTILSGHRYNATVLLAARRITLLMLTVFVASFVALYPYLEPMGFCASSGCPEVSQASHSGTGVFSTGCLIAVLTAVPGLVTLLAFFMRRTVDQHWTTQLYLAPDPDPPRTSS